MSPRSSSREVLAGRVILALTLVACALLARDLHGILAQRLEARAVGPIVEHVVFAAIVGCMLYGNLVYQLTRLGYLFRRAAHRPDAEAVIRARLPQRPPSIAVLVPSYREDADVVRRSLMAAALQDYPDRRVVLLIDDPPHPPDPESRTLLAAVRELPPRVAAACEKPATRFREALADFAERLRTGGLSVDYETLRVAQLYAEAAAWFREQAANEPAQDHAVRCYVDLVLERPALGLLQRSLELERRAVLGTHPDVEELRRDYEYLAQRFTFAIGSFERKRYVNLSHEPNKAMNLNAYIQLLGGSHRQVQREDGVHLVCADAGSGAEVVVPTADFLITLDADSLISHDYALRLVDVMLKEGNERVAVAQTPYSAFPGAPDLLERIAGATTDIQYIGHQGFTRHGATYWVGANALLRKAALDEIRTLDVERGFEVQKFVQDRTVIEDTESSVDLIERGWSLINYPERLAYSASPPDFGALLIQRRRWANGGLLILPKLLRYLWRSRWSRSRLLEALCRVHYLVSIAGVNLGLLVLLAYPFEQSMESLWLPVAALPYFVLNARDLAQAGYRWTDAIRAYALNLMLLPVNLGGVASSLRQGITGHKAPFGRTPKVATRTCIPPRYVGAPLVLLAVAFALIALDFERHRWMHAGFGLVNGALFAYGFARFIGLRAGIHDLLRLRERPARSGVAEARGGGLRTGRVGG